MKDPYEEWSKFCTEFEKEFVEKDASLDIKNLAHVREFAANRGYITIPEYEEDISNSFHGYVFLTENTEYMALEITVRDGIWLHSSEVEP